MADISYGEFNGVRNDVAPERFGPGDLVTADNCDLDATGKLQRRQGYASVLAGDCHSLFSAGDVCLFVQGASLRRLMPDYASVSLRDDLTPPARMAYCAVNGRIYYANGYAAGVIDDGQSRSWGLTPPPYQPLATAISGELSSGAYQFALTYLRRDGQESGAGLAESIDVGAGGGIAFSDIAVAADPDVAYKCLYLSTANGEQLYRALTLDNAATSASYTGDGVDLQSPLDTQFLQAPPPGHLIACYRGRLYVGVDQWLFPSEPYGYELFDLRGYLPFDSRLSLVAPVDDGLYVATQTQTWFLAGRGPDEFEAILKAPYGAVLGSLAYAPASLVKQAQNQGEAQVAFWLTPQGVCLGLNGGQLINLTQQYAIDPGGEGAGLFRRKPLSQYIACYTP